MAPIEYRVLKGCIKVSRRSTIVNEVGLVLCMLHTNLIMKYTATHFCSLLRWVCCLLNIEHVNLHDKYYGL